MIIFIQGLRKRIISKLRELTPRESTGIYKQLKTIKLDDYFR